MCSAFEIMYAGVAGYAGFAHVLLAVDARRPKMSTTQAAKISIYMVKDAWLGFFPGVTDGTG